jgi:hypothetical protein
MSAVPPVRIDGRCMRESMARTAARMRVIRWRRVAGAAIAGAACTALAAAPAAQSAPAPSWLAAVNAFRTASVVGPVTEDTAWSLGIGEHLIYLARTPARDFVGPYRSLHTEDPASPYYTAAGAAAARSSDLYEGVHAPTAAIDGWMAAPFHAIGILRAQLRHVGFAFSASSASAGLDVIRGLTGSASPRPILYPGPGAHSALTTYAGNEVPNPLETCHWRTAGLPLIALLPGAPAAATTVTLVARGGIRVPTCLVDQYTYRTTDAIYGPTGLAILKGDHAVVVIPRHPLTGTRYTATIRQPGLPAIAWSFCGPHCVGPPAAPSITRLVVGPGRITVAWRRPAADGGRPITSYLVRVTGHARRFVCTTRRTKCTITGLSRHQTYAVRVVARTTAGTSAPSSVRRAVTG